MATKIGAIAVPDLHERVDPQIIEILAELDSPRVLDVGAGHGCLSQRLHEEGFDVSACDLYPESFEYEPVECRKPDDSGRLPYDDGSMDAAVAVEVIEHISDAASFFRECARVLRPGGRLIVTSPNVLSLKSRLQYLFSGHAYGFPPLSAERRAGSQHIASRTLDQYRWLAETNGLKLIRTQTDKVQRSSALLAPAWLLLRALTFPFGPRSAGQNRLHLLVGRTLVAVFGKTEGA